MKYFGKQINKHLRLNKVEWISILFVIGISCAGWIQMYIYPNFSYIDDIFTVFIILCAAFKTFFFIRCKLNKYEKLLIKLVIGLFITGIFGNLLSDYQTNFFAIFVDILAWLKLFFIYPCMCILITYRNGNRYYDIVIKYVKLLILIIFSSVILNMLFPFEFVDTKYDRFAIHAFAFGSHPTFTVALSCSFLSLFLFDYKKNIVWIILCCIIAMATLRYKAFSYICIVIMMLLFVKNQTQINRKYYIIAVFIACIVAYDQISYYFFNPEMSRAAAFRASLKIAEVFFPIGSGYATFGTIMSGQYYSKAYEIYGLSNKWGFSSDAYSFIGDGGWATIIGQFGIIGLIIVIYMICVLYKSIVMYRTGNLNLLPVLSIFSYLLIACSSELGVASDYSILFAFCLTLITNKYKYEQYKAKLLYYR
jgi:hypothetical protein